MKITRNKIAKTALVAAALTGGLITFAAPFEAQAYSGGGTWTCVPHEYASYCVTPQGTTAYYHYKVGG